MGQNVRNRMRWDKSTPCRPVNNIISSDFPKYVPQPWQYMEGEPYMTWLLSYEYQRKWIEERDAWSKNMYPENTVVNIDMVRRYVNNFKNTVKPKKPKEKNSFRIKKFQGINSLTVHTRAPGDKAMQYLKKK